MSLVAAAPDSLASRAPRARRTVRITRVRARVMLCAVLGVAAAVRMVGLDNVGFNSDEAVYAGQAAALAGNPVYAGTFPVFRAHPMLVQSLLSLVYRAGEHDTAGRFVIAALGVATVAAVYLVGAELYGRGTGLLAAAFVAIMPYHVLVTRQVLLDGPMVLCATLTLWCVARFARTGRLSWMVAAGATMGLAMLAKESSIVMAGAVYAFLALSPSVRRPLVGSLVAAGVTAAVFTVHPVTQALAGRASTGQSYFMWQLLRPPNHDWLFYAQTVPTAVGPLVVAAAVFGGLATRQLSGHWREVLLGCWALTPIVVFEVWPVKGYQYLLPAAPALAVLAARGIGLLPALGRVGAPRVRAGAAVLVLASLLVALVPQLVGAGGTRFLAGTGGVPGGRETGLWIGANTPAGATVMTLGPSMANIITYYGHRPAYGLSVSPNPLHRNPSYEPIRNPDRSMRHGDLQYVVWDAYSAARSPFFDERLRTLTDRRHGRVVHTEYALGTGPDGEPAQVPVVVVYEVRP